MTSRPQCRLVPSTRCPGPGGRPSHSHRDLNLATLRHIGNEFTVVLRCHLASDILAITGAGKRCGISRGPGLGAFCHADAESGKAHADQGHENQNNRHQWKDLPAVFPLHLLIRPRLHVITPVDEFDPKGRSTGQTNLREHCRR